MSAIWRIDVGPVVRFLYNEPACRLVSWELWIEALLWDYGIAFQVINPLNFTQMLDDVDAEHPDYLHDGALELIRQIMSNVTLGENVDYIGRFKHHPDRWYHVVVYGYRQDPIEQLRSMIEMEGTDHHYPERLRHQLGLW